MQKISLLVDRESRTSELHVPYKKIGPSCPWLSGKRVIQREITALSKWSKCCRPSRSNPEHVLRKIHHYTFGRKISQRPFIGFYPKIVHFISQKFWWPFFSHRPFLRFSSLPCLTDCPSFLFLNSTFSQQKFLDDLFSDFANLMTSFLVIDLFFTIFYPSVFYRWWLLFPIFAHYTPRYPLYTHPHAVFHFSTPCFVLS